MKPTHTDLSATSAARTVALGTVGTTVLMAAGHGVNDMFTGMVPALLPVFQSRFGLEESSLALLIGTFAFSSSFLGPFFGSLADRYGARLVAALAIAFTAALLSLPGLVTEASILLGLLALAGLGSAAFHPAGGAIVRESAGSKAGLALGLFSAGGMLGYALGPIVVMFLVGGAGLGAAPWLVLPGLLAAFVVFWFAPTPPPRAMRPAVSGKSLGLLKGPVGLLTVAATLNGLAMLTFTSSFPLWMVSEYGLGADDIALGLTLTIFALASAVGGIAGGTLAIRIRRERVVALTMTGAILPLYLLFTLHPGTPEYYAAVAAAGLLTYAGVPLLVHGAQDLAGGRTGAASGMLFGLASAFAAVIYVGMGWLQTKLGIAPVLAITYLGLLPAALLAYVTLIRAPLPAMSSASHTAIACGCFEGLVVATSPIQAPICEQACGCVEQHRCALPA
jgi:MFS transporter, FSR family, fosmidomycin resistance protein